MHSEITRKKQEIASVCRAFGVMRLSVFGSAARASDFEPGRSDADLLVEFGPWAGGDPYPHLKSAMEAILQRRVDLLDREAFDDSRNTIRRQNILTGMETLYEA